MAFKIMHEKSGRPYLCANGHRSDLDISISHSQSSKVFVLALDKNIRVGIDIEIYRDISTEEMTDLIRCNYTCEEYLDFCNLPLELKKKSFFRSWAQKEAIIKCLGITLSSLNLFRVQMNCQLPPQLIWSDPSLGLSLPSSVDLYEIKKSANSVCILAITRNN